MSDNLANKLANQEKIASVKNSGGANIPVQQKPGQDDFLDENASIQLRLQRMRYQAARNMLPNTGDDEDEDEPKEEEDENINETANESVGQQPTIKSRFGKADSSFKNEGNTDQSPTGDENEKGINAEKDGDEKKDEKKEGDENSDNKKDEDDKENKPEDKGGEKKDDKTDKNKENEPKTETDADRAGKPPPGINNPESLKELENQNADSKDKKTGKEKAEKPDGKKQEEEVKSGRAMAAKKAEEAAKKLLKGDLEGGVKEGVGSAAKAGSQWALTVLWGSVWLDWTLLSLLGLNVLLVGSLLFPNFVCQFGEDYLLGKWFPDKDFAKITEIMILAAIDLFVFSILLIFFLMIYQIYNCGWIGNLNIFLAQVLPGGKTGFEQAVECMVKF